jgi:hypothetical protein
VAGSRGEGFADVVAAAVDDLAENGYSSPERLAYWEERIRRAAEASLEAPARMEEMLRDALASTFRRLVDRGGIVKMHPGIERWAIERVRPALRAELDKRIIASANLIRLNRKQRIEETLRRFSGWATSIPNGGSTDPDKRDERARVKKPLARLPFEERRVLIDQGHKLTASINDVVSVGNGAIAAIWRSNWRQPNYDYRLDHKDRDLKVYGIRGSWSFEKGLTKKGPDGWVDEITRPAEEPFCRCWYVYLYSLKDLSKAAPEMITARGREAIEAAKARRA